jgi:hypothetical protein
VDDCEWNDVVAGDHPVERQRYREVRLMGTGGRTEIVPGLRKNSGQSAIFFSSDALNHGRRWGAWIVRTLDSVTIHQRWRQRLMIRRLRDRPFSGQG